MLAGWVEPSGGCHLWLRESEGRKAPTAGAPEDDAHAKSRDKPRRAVVCAACGHPITDVSARIEKAGRHHHTCVNPAGIVYRIGCFGKAPGCVGVGEWSTYYSWFAGYAWQVAVCARCAVHLGWGFSDADSRFYGLILERIAERDE